MSEEVSQKHEWTKDDYNKIVRESSKKTHTAIALDISCSTNLSLDNLVTWATIDGYGVAYDKKNNAVVVFLDQRG